MGDSDEDSPIADYLKSVESNEAMVKPSPLQLGTLAPEEAPMILSKQISASLYRVWRQSVLHDTFSVSLPIMEEMAFEEKFKYLIVTSHLLNDTLSTHPKQKPHSHAAPPFHTTAATTRSATIGTMVTLTGLLAALGFERQHNEQDKDESFWLMPTMTMVFASGVSFFFVYRHLRRASIRQLYQCALTQLQNVLEQSQLLDNKVHKALVTIQTPILRSQLSRLLRRAFIVYEEAIIDLSDWVTKPTLARLFDMYNIQSVATLSSATTKSSGDDMDDDGITLDYLKTLAHLMHLKRRECMLQFLALTIMTGSHDSIQSGYETGWKNINSVLLRVKNETTAFARDVTMASDGPSGALDTSTHVETQPFIHRLSRLDQHLRTTEARVHLCNEELQRRQRLSNDQALDLKREYMAMGKDIQHLVAEWEAGKQALDTLLTPPSELETPPSPLPSPTMTPTAPTFSFVVTSEDASGCRDWPISSSNPAVYDGMDDVNPMVKRKQVKPSGLNFD